MLSSEPVETSSRTNTSQPFSSSRSERCEPMKPAPPVISAFLDTLGAYRPLRQAFERLGDLRLARSPGAGFEQGGALKPPLAGAGIGMAELVAQVDDARLLLDRSFEL